MVDEKKEFETWEEVINKFLTDKSLSDEEKYLKEAIKGVSTLCEKNGFHGKDYIKKFFSTKKEKDQLAIDFQRMRFNKILKFRKVISEFDFDKFEADYEVKYETLLIKYKPCRWISDAAINASSVSFATHVIKLTHSKIDSSSLYDKIDSFKPDFLTTSILREKSIDGAVSGNQFAPIFQFLELELNGNKLATEFAAESTEVLEPFASNDKEVVTWNNGFKKALSNEQLSTHFLAKQVYFPINSDESSYHLLCHIKSSSLAHAIFEGVFDPTQKDIRALREKSKYSPCATTLYPQKSRISVTASNHSNASQLNGKRGGKLHLFSTQPPIWENQSKPPIYKKSLFDENFFYQNMKEDINYLRDFLLRFNRIDLSIKNPERRKWIDRWLANIIDEFLFFVGNIQNLSAGWTVAEDIKLKPAHQYLLDPYRKGTEFQSARKGTDWQAVICDDFAHWVNRRLIGQDKQFTPQSEHRRMWVSLLEQPLREHSEMLDAELKFQA